MTLLIYLRDTRICRVQGCTGDPTVVSQTILSGYYRDIFTLDGSTTGVYFTGIKNSGSPPAPFAESIAVPTSMLGRIIPTGNVVIEKLANDTESRVAVSEFQIAVSDEIAHAGLRQIEFQESYWAFPVNLDGVIMNMMFRQAVVDGWGNAEDPN